MFKNETALSAIFPGSTIVERVLACSSDKYGAKSISLLKLATRLLILESIS